MRADACRETPAARHGGARVMLHKVLIDDTCLHAHSICRAITLLNPVPRSPQPLRAVGLPASWKRRPCGPGARAATASDKDAAIANGSRCAAGLTFTGLRGTPCARCRPLVHAPCYVPPAAQAVTPWAFRAAGHDPDRHTLTGTGGGGSSAPSLPRLWATAGPPSLHVPDLRLAGCAPRCATAVLPLPGDEANLWSACRRKRACWSWHHSGTSTPA